MTNRLHRALSVTGVVAALLIVSAFPIQHASAQSGVRPSLGTPSAGKFRITINGFTVNQATLDHILDIDGVGDEVFVSANVIVMDSSQGLATPLSTLETKVYGEKRRDLVTGKFVWEGRSPAGSGTPRGGLRNRNTGPRAEPWKRFSQPSSDSLPLELWCGTLTQGQNVVVIIPSIWEWDGVKSNFGQWVAWGNQVATDLTNNKAFRDLIGAERIKAVELGKQLTFGAAISLDSAGLVGGEADRPIGVKKSTKPKTFEFTPEHKFVLNYQSADWSARETGAGSVGGKAPGMSSVMYTDDPSYNQGRYTLHVQIERIDGGKCSHEYVAPPKGPKIDPNKPKP